MRFKDGVNPFGLKPELLAGLLIAEGIFNSHGFPFTVTSLNDGVHMYTSKHYDGAAGDVRTRDIPMRTLHVIKQELAVALGNNPDYDIVIEEDHMHLEYQPKKRIAE